MLSSNIRAKRQAPDRGATAQLDLASETRDLARKPAETSPIQEGVSPAISPSPVLTIAVNRDVADTHSIFINGAENAVGFSIPETGGVSSNLQAFREILLNASYRLLRSRSFAAWREVTAA